MPPTFYNFTESGRVYSFDDIFIPKDFFSQGLFYGWGYASSGQIGDNINVGVGLVGRSTPKQEFTTSITWKQVSAGMFHCVAIKTDGTLWGWGGNGEAQVGDNSLVARSTPRQIGTGTDWKQVSAGSFHNSAIKTDGTLWCWGLNASGQLGDNTLFNRSTPRQEFTSTNNWVQVQSGANHTLALKGDGTLWSWGLNDAGQVGDNTNVSRSTPVQVVVTGTDWKQISASANFNGAIKTDGTLWTWGSNSFGRLGDNTTASRSTPRQVGTATNWKQVSAGYNVSAAIKTDGTLWTWGRNQFGVLGNNESDGGVAGANSRSTPQQEFTSSTNWKQVSAGFGLQTHAFEHMSAIKTDGTLWTWGYNLYGQIGDNTTITRSTPVREFTSSTNWRQVSVNGDFVAALQYSDSPLY